jgi:hypothetical protein
VVAVAGGRDAVWDDPIIAKVVIGFCSFHADPSYSAGSWISQPDKRRYLFWCHNGPISMRPHRSGHFGVRTT